MLEECKYNQTKIIAVLSCFFIGIMVHMFGLVNIIHNYDNIAVATSGYGTGVTSGRWFLDVLGGLSLKYFGCYNLSWINGILSILILAISMYFLIEIFEIKNKIYAIILGAAWVAFPSITSALLFKYTVIFYSIALFLSVLAAYVVIVNKKYCFFAILLSGLLTACALGIYQAYFPVTVAIFVLFLIQQTLKKDESYMSIIRKAICFLASLILGLIFYYILLKLSLIYYHAELSSYQGVGDMGKITWNQYPHLVWKAFLDFCMMPLNNYYKLSPIPIVSKLYVFLGVISVAMILLILIKNKIGKIKSILCIALCAMFPIAVNLIVIMCPQSWIYTLMVNSYVIVLFVPVVVGKEVPEFLGWGKKVIKVASVLIGIAIGVITFEYSYVANITYTAEYYANRQIENLTSSIVTQVRMTDGFKKEQEWLILGSYDDSLMYFPWENAPFVEGTANPNRLYNSYSRFGWFHQYVGYEIRQVDENRREQLKDKEEVKNMPSWPSNGSIKIVEDTVVIKFSD